MSDQDCAEFLIWIVRKRAKLLAIKLTKFREVFLHFVVLDEHPFPVQVERHLGWWTRSSDVRFKLIRPSLRKSVRRNNFPFVILRRRLHKYKYTIEVCYLHQCSNCGEAKYKCSTRLAREVQIVLLSKQQTYIVQKLRLLLLLICQHTQHHVRVLVLCSLVNPLCHNVLLFQP